MKQANTELLPAVTEPMPVAAPSAVPTVPEMLHAVIKGGVTEGNVGALQKMVDLYERMEARNAAKEFADAFVKLQSEMPAVQASKAVKNNDGSHRYTYAPYEEIMDAVRPLLTKHGFTVSFDTEVGEGRITSICKLAHTGGHSSTNRFSVRIGKGPPGASETQADGAARTYARRGALCDCLNIVTEKDTDARVEGSYITPEQAESLRKRVRETGSEEAGFLKFAGAATFETIPAARLSALDAALRKKEKTT